MLKIGLKKFLRIISYLLVLLILGIYLIGPYFSFSNRFKSEIADSLKIFDLQKSVFDGDQFKSCWYDSGDYLIFSPRIALTTFYLSEAYKYSSNQDVKEDLNLVIKDGLDCLLIMNDLGIKQFRDQSSHGLILPPKLHKVFYPESTYKYSSNEGGDIILLLALIYKNLGQEEHYKSWVSQVADKKQTFTEKCCEEGPIGFKDEDYLFLKKLSGLDYDIPATESGWSLGFKNLFLIKNKKVLEISNILKHESLDPKNTLLKFSYIGGNYDIAGLISLERIYSKISGDESYKNFSQYLARYLKGNNDYNLDFTNHKKIHHPCGQWWSYCGDFDILINGIDEKNEFNLNRVDVWRLTEMQLVGQAKYILSEVLYNNY